MCMRLMLLLLPCFFSAGLLALDVDRHGEDDPGAERAEAIIAPQAGLLPFVLPWDDGAAGPTDMRFLNAGPAGSLGYLRVAANGHIHAGDERQRFVAGNIIFDAAVSDKETSAKAAARMAKFGFNLMRFHHIDNVHGVLPNKDLSGEMDSDRLDRLHFLIAEMKKQGVYSNLNLLVTRRHRAGDGIENLHLVKGKMAHLIGMWHDGAFALQQAYARDLLTPINPYTGLSLAEDPAVGFIEIINENGLANTWFSPARSAFAGDLNDQPENLMAPLRRRWSTYLEQAHGGPDEALAVWGSDGAADLKREDGGIDFIPTLDFRKRPLALRRDWLRFLREVEGDYYKRMRSFLREEIGAKALLIGSTVHSSWLNIQAEFDVIDSHVYFGNPRWRKGTWNWKGMDWHIDNKSHVDTSPGGRLRWISMGRVAGKPFSISEYNHAAPNLHAGEAPVYLAAHAALQDWDALYLFPYASRLGFTQDHIMGNVVCSHPTKMANIPVAAALFRRGDLRMAEGVVSAWMSPDKEIDIAAEKGGTWNIANGFKLGIDGDDIMRHRLAVTVGETDPQLPSMPAYDDGKVFSSDTGEMVWDGTDPRGAVLQIDTPRCKSVLGMVCDRRHALGDWEFIVGRTSSGGATISVVALDGDSLATATRALIVATGRADNTGMAWKRVQRYDRKKQTVRNDWELDSWGEAPTLIEPVPARISFPCTAEQVRVQMLDALGQPAADLPLLRVHPGRVSVDIGGRPTLWYLISWQR